MNGVREINVGKFVERGVEGGGEDKAEDGGEGEKDEEGEDHEFHRLYSMIWWGV
jgi:hypothetical protein